MMACNQEKGARLAHSSKTKLLEIHQWVFVPTVPLKIIPPIDFTVLAAALHGANPVVLATSMCGLDMTP
jgi:hypothetical protein